MLFAVHAAISEQRASAGPQARAEGAEGQPDPGRPPGFVLQHLAAIFHHQHGAGKRGKGHLPRFFGGGVKKRLASDPCTPCCPANVRCVFGDPSALQMQVTCSQSYSTRNVDFAVFRLTRLRANILAAFLFLFCTFFLSKATPTGLESIGKLRCSPLQRCSTDAIASLPLGAYTAAFGVSVCTEVVSDAPIRKKNDA